MLMFFTYSQVSSIKIHLKLHKFVMSCKLTTIFFVNLIYNKSTNCCFISSLMVR